MTGGLFLRGIHFSLRHRSSTVERPSTWTTAAGTYLRLLQTIYENLFIWRLSIYSDTQFIIQDALVFCFRHFLPRHRCAADQCCYYDPPFACLFALSVWKENCSNVMSRCSWNLETREDVILVLFYLRSEYIYDLNSFHAEGILFQREKITSRTQPCPCCAVLLAWFRWKMWRRNATRTCVVSQPRFAHWRWYVALLLTC